MRYLSILPMVFLGIFSFAQSGEFRVYDNGLIYSDTTVEQLHHIVDSLNVKFRTCELHKVYKSKKQGVAHFIELEKGNIKQAHKDLKNDIGYQEFMDKYPKARIEKDVLVTKWEYENYKGEHVIEFSELPLDGGYGRDIELETFKEDERGAFWVFDYWEGSEYSEESVRAFYFPEGMNSKPISEEYARLVQYSECMVDTNTQIFKEDAFESGGWGGSPDLGKKADAFVSYIHRETHYPDDPVGVDFDEKNWDEYYKKYRIWDSLRIEVIEQELVKTDEFKIMLQEAVEDALDNGGSSDEFEQYVGLYYSKKTALELKRSRRVIGGCSMDQAPRVHAMNIAVLSAETVNWETFLRSHLDIMNDRFERVSDGSYAWAGRKTYIRELEELDINVLDLLLGISLRVENPSQNHYFGSIGRLGRALAETQYPDQVEAQMQKMVADSRLDDYNRLLIYFLYLNYVYNIPDTSNQKEGVKRLKAAASTLPEYMKGRVTTGE